MRISVYRDGYPSQDNLLNSDLNRAFEVGQLFYRLKTQVLTLQQVNAYLSLLSRSSTSSVKEVCILWYLQIQTMHLHFPAYGVVYRARDYKTSKIVALKQVRISPEERQNGVPITAIREISILRSLKHENIVNVLDVAVGDTAMDEIYMVMEYAEQVGDT